jgi:DNA invertase Pin-like site-specific DNA recombinase
MKIGYARVSTEDQNNNAQKDALKHAGCDIIIEEKRSGGTMKRPLLLQMLAALKPGDVVVVYKMDRIARSLRNLMEIQDRIHNAKADFKSLTEVIDTTSPAGRMIFQILGAFAEFERALISERTKVGLQAAMARGSKPGRVSKIKPDDQELAVQQWLSGKYTKQHLANKYDVNISSIKRLIQRRKLSQSRPCVAS